MDTVGEILAQRSEHDPLWKAGAVGTLLLHAGVGAALLIASRLPTRRMFISPQAVAVRLVSLQSVRGSRAEAEQPVSRPVIEKPQDVPEPSPKAMPLPEEKKSKKEPPPPVHPSKTSPQAKTKASGSAVDLPQPGESAEGSPTGVAGAGSTFGTSLSAFDSADFNYSYYVSRMLATIGANWFKPTDQAVSPPVIFFRIGRDGTISDVQIERTSGLPFVDRAAQRAVMVSSPLPPLPADFHESSLGVHLRFQ